MLEGKVAAEDLERKNEIEKLLEQRRQTYGSVSVRSAISNDRGAWKNALTRVDFLHKSHHPPQDMTHRYPDFMLVQRALTVEDFKNLLENLVSNGKLEISGCPGVKTEGRFASGRLRYLPSDDEVFKLEWPANHFTFEPKSDFKGSIHGEHLVTLDTPLFPGPHEVLRVWTGIDESRYNVYPGTIVFLMPNFQVKIDEIRLSSKLLTVRLREKESALDDVVGKLYCEALGGEAMQKDITLSQNTTSVELAFVPDFWQFYILSKKTGEVLDFRKVHAHWPSLPRGVILEISPADVEEVIARGENQTVEFKQDVSKKPAELVETVVAFSNTTGGTIFVGVDDNGNIVGTYEQELEKRITNQLRDICEPPIDVTVERKIINERTLYMIRVPEGESKPYNYRGRGVFVRSGSTDRVASRIELDSFYEDKKSGYPFGYSPYGTF